MLRIAEDDPLPGVQVDGRDEETMRQRLEGVLQAPGQEPLPDEACQGIETQQSGGDGILEESQSPTGEGLRNSPASVPRTQR